MEYIEETNRIVVVDDLNAEIGEVTWSLSEHLMIIDHTFVREDYRGQDIAQTLVYRAVNMAREKGLKIIPLCPFAKREFMRREDYQDVLKQ